MNIGHSLRKESGERIHIEQRKKEDKEKLRKG